MTRRERGRPDRGGGTGREREKESLGERERGGERA